MNSATIAQKRWNYCNVLRDYYKGERYLASLRKNGYVAYGGERYASHSAARALVGRAANGWRFWHYKNENGAQWVALSDLRQYSDCSQNCFKCS